MNEVEIEIKIANEYNQTGEIPDWWLDECCSDVFSSFIPTPNLCEISDVKRFINKFPKKHKSCVKTLKKLIRNFPNLIYVKRNANTGVELCCVRKALIKKLNKSKVQELRTIVFASFERNLKHQGLKVVQSTHGNNCKIWQYEQ